MISTYSTLFHHLRKALGAIYADGESAAIAKEVLQDVTGLTYTQGLVKADPLRLEESSSVEAILEQLQKGMPMQYALGHAWFGGRTFWVNDAVLIPRPETEELVHWIVEEWRGRQQSKMIDIGTGSGCIPITVKCILPAAIVEAIDISESALVVAQRNADDIGVNVAFRHLDFLHAVQRGTLGMYDVIVSNPPYIPIAEAEVLDANVREWEPHTALFVPDDDPLLFYKLIAEFGKGHLREGGAVYCELHENYSDETASMFEAHGYDVILRQDINGKNRMLRAVK